MKNLVLILVAIFMVNMANAGMHSSIVPNSKQSNIVASTLNTNSAEYPHKVKDVLTTYTIIISMNPANAGYAYGAGTFNANQTCAINVHSNAGYTFAYWTENGSIVSYDTIYIFSVTANRNLVANFNTITATTYTITTSANPTLGGTVTGGGTYNSNQYCMVNASANPGFIFANWTENGTVVSFDSTYSFNVTTNRNLVANFSTTVYTINTSTNPTTNCFAFGGGTYIPNQICKLTAYPLSTFTNWTENGSIVSYDSIYIFTVTANRNLVANFNTTPPPPYTVTTSSYPTNGGSATGNGGYYANQPCNLIAIPNTGYSFANWTENGSIVSFNATYSFTVNSNRNLVANFATTVYNITTSTNPTSGCSVSGGGTYIPNQSCKLRAFPASSFINWTENSSIVSTDSIYIFNVTANRNLVANFNIIQYSITTTANPTIGGSISGSGTFNANLSCTLHATPNSGYIFTNWTENGNIVSTNANYTFTVTANRSLVANFTVIQYTITTLSNPTIGGSTSGGGTYNVNQSCTVHAIPNSGYAFANWTLNGNIVSTNANYAFTVTANKNLVANFIITTQYTINVSASPTTGGTVSGGGTFNANQICIIHAIPNSGYYFSGWTENGNIVSTDSNYYFNVLANRNLVANFNLITTTQYTITVTANPTNGGYTYGGGTYYANQMCLAHAYPYLGYVFTGWTENGNIVSTDTNYFFVVTANRNLVANFTALQYTITTLSNPVSGGNTTGGGTFSYNQVCTVSATPNSGYTFANWTLNGNIVSSSANYTFYVQANKNLVANFNVLTTQYTINVSANPVYGGSAFGGGTFNANQICSLHAFFASGYSFAGWTENGNTVSTDTNYSFLVTANRNLVANFSLLQYTITTTANPLLGGTTSGGGTFNYIQPCTVGATSNSGFTFVNWTGNGMVLSFNPNYSFSVTSNLNLIANFSTNPYTINITANPGMGGSVSGGGTFTAGQNCTLSALSNNNYTFANWTENGNIVSNSASYQFTVNSGRNLVANFTSANFTVTTSSMPVNGGNTYGGGTFYYNQPCVVNATNSNGYTFVNWTINGEVISFDSIYSFNVDTNMNLVANFSSNPIIITTSVSPLNAGNIQGGGMYALNQSCNLIAQPATGYSFVNWTENGNIVSTYYYYPFTVTSNRNFVANFNVLPTCSAQFTLFPDSTVLHHYFIVNNASGVAPFQYFWSWGDGTSDSVAYPSHTYAASGNYTICLTITDALNCNATYCYNANLQKSTNDIISLQVIQGGVGIKPEIKANQVRIYPNPAKDNLSIESNSNSKQMLDIVNLIGQSVYTATIYGNTTIDVSALPKGVYFLRLNTSKETVIKKFVKE